MHISLVGYSFSIVGLVKDEEAILYSVVKMYIILNNI